MRWVTISGFLVMVWFWLVFALVLLPGCAMGTVESVEPLGEGASACLLSEAKHPLPPTWALETYRGRGFLAAGNHLGWDIVAPEGTPVTPIGCGIIRAARSAQGYGTWVVVIEHRLPAPQNVPERPRSDGSHGYDSFDLWTSSSHARGSRPRSSVGAVCGHAGGCAHDHRLHRA
jgi:hypothetical protein